jgi:hypothetical protein
VEKLCSKHLFFVVPADSIFSELWNFCCCLILYPGAEFLRLEQEAKSINSLGSCPKFCLSEEWGQLSNFNLSDYVPDSLGLLVIMEQWFLRLLKVVVSGELGGTYKESAYFEWIPVMEQDVEKLESDNGGNAGSTYKCKINCRIFSCLVV